MASKSAADWKAEGNAALQAKNFDDAIQAYTNAIELDPSNHVFFSNRSAAKLSKGDASGALADADLCIEKKGDWPKGFSRKGAALHAMGRLEESLAAYEQGLAQDPSNAGLLRGKQEVEMDLTGGAGGGAGGAGMGNLVQMMFSDANLGQMMANPQTRELMMKPGVQAKLEALKTNPDGLMAAMNDPDLGQIVQSAMGMALGGLGGVGAMGGMAGGMPGAAGSAGAAASASGGAPKPAEPEPEPEPEEELDEEELARRARKAEALEKKAEGNGHYKKREFAEALACYDAALEIDPEDITYRLNKAAVYYEQGELDKSIKECEEAIEFGRSNQASFKLIAKAYGRIGTAQAKAGNVEAAIAAFDTSLTESYDEKVDKKRKRMAKELKKQQEQAYVDPAKGAEAKARGNEHFKAGRWGDAIEEYSEAIKRDPTNAIYYCNRATARNKLMDVGALKDCEKALELDPTYVKAWARMGRIQLLMKEPHKAMESFSKGLELDPNDVECQQGAQQTQMKISSQMYSGEVDEEQQRRAMADPEVQSILRDPMMQSAMADMQSGREGLERVMSDPVMSAKVSKLIAAGVLRFGGPADGAAAAGAGGRR